MKHYTKLFFAAAVAALGLASCAKEVAPVETPKDNLVTVHFGATAGIEGATKATLTPNEQETLFTSAWENGDVLSVEYSNDNGTAGTKGTVSASWATDHFEAKMPEYHGMWNYNVVYPAPDTESAVDFGSARTQKGNAYNSKYDLMKGSAIEENADAGKTADGKDIVFNMTRQTAIAYFHLTSTLDEEVVSAKLSVTDGNIASSLVMLLDHTDGFDLSTNDLNEITITFEEGTAPKASNFQLWFNVLPTMYTKMTLTVETTGHTMTISRNAPNIDKYVAGKLYKVVKNIDDKWVAKGGETPGTKDFVLVTSAQSDWSGSYLLVGKYSTETTPKVSYYAYDESIPADKYSWGKCSEVIVENNTIASTYGTMALEIVPGTAENTYSILTPSGKYLSASAAKKFNLSKTYSADNCDFTISLDKDNSIIISQITGTGTETKTKQIRYNHNGGKGGMRWYDSITADPVYLYKGPHKTALETPANLQVRAEKVVSWDAVSGAASYEVTIGENTYTTETNSYNAAAIADDYYDVAVVAVPSDKDNYKNSAAATLTGVKFGTPTLATPTLKEGVIDGASISVSWSVDERATAGYNCELFKGDVKIGESKTVNAGAVTFTGLDAETEYVVKVNAIAVEGAKAYAASSVATLDVTTKAASATANDGSLEHPYTAAEAIAAIDANTTGLTGKHVKGIVTEVVSHNPSYGSMVYIIKSGEKTLKIFNGYDFGHTKFLGTDDLKVGDEVVVFGDLIKYNTTYELNTNNYLISINGETQIYRGLAVSEPKTAFTVGDAFEFGGKALQVWRGKADVNVTASATFSGYNMSTEGKQTVTVTVGEETVTYEINVRAAGGEAPKAYILTFPGTDEAEKVNDYISTWDATRDGFTWKLANWNNYNNGWNQVKAGRKKTASVATITTKTTIPEAISTVTMTIDAINATYVNSIKMEVISATGATIETIPGTAKNGPCVFNVTKPQNDCKYKITVDCKGMTGNNAKNGFVQVSKVIYTNN